jgi:hypothetical protein
MKTSLLILACITLLASCASTKTTLDVTWDDPKHNATHIKKILIIGISQDEGVRIAFENDLQMHLEKTGVEVVTSSTDLNITDKTDKETIQKEFSGQGIDAVLVSRLVSVDNETKYIPGRTDYIPTNYYGGGLYGFDGPHGYYGDFYGYYAPTYQAVHTPGYLKNTQVIRIETNVYETKNNKLIWSAVSKTFDPKSTTDAINSLNNAISSQLVKDGFFK